jgi:alkanesulfonate monooxygenase SsuD/methylene tetrahydromethanopterin reductase-like flavin-dependent oxidoreductase (luciferase family)
LDFGLGVLGYHGCWDDVAFAEEHGFATAGFVDSPLLGGEMFACMARAASVTDRIRLGTFLAVPSNRIAPVAAQGIATISLMAPGRVFMGMGTGFTSRNTFGLPRLPARAMQEYARECRGLLDGDEVVHQDERGGHRVRFGQRHGDYIDLEGHIPIYMAGDGPKAIKAIGETADGYIMTLMYAHAMDNGDEVFGRSFDAVKESARASGRNLDDAYTICSLTLCVLDEGESAVSPRALERVGAYAMMPFHAYSDNPAIEEHLPPPVQERLGVYRDKVLSRFEEPIYQHSHRGHLSHLLPGEEEVLTEEIVRMTTLTGTAQQLADRLGRLEAAGTRNFSIWAPPTKTRETVLEVHEKLMPLLAGAAA